MTTLSRRVRQLAVGIGLAVAVVACGSSLTDVSPDASAETLGTGPSEERTEDVALEEGSLFEALAALDLAEADRVELLYSEARSEGRVRLYSSMNLELNEAWKRGFELAYPGVTLEFVTLGRPGDLLERVRAETVAGRHLADVIQGAVVGGLLEQEGFVARHHNVAVPSEFPLHYVGEFGAIFTLSPQVITWNTDLVDASTAPREIDDFLKPQNSGCVFSGAPTWISTMIVERGLDATVDWFERFIDNGGVFDVGSTSGATRSLAAGEFACMVYAHVFTVEAMRTEAGAPLDWHVAPGTPAAAQRLYVSANAPHPHAAALFIYWALGPDGAQVIADDGRLPIFPGVDAKTDRLNDLITPGSESNLRIQVLTAEEAHAVDEQAFALIERFSPVATG